MQRLGFVHDMLDVKVLILFVMARVNYPASSQQIYELCLQDDCVSYFDVQTAIPQMVKSGHLKELEEDQFEITEKGRTDGELTKESVAFSVRCKAENAVNRFNRQLRRSSMVRTRLFMRDNGEYTVNCVLNDDTGELMTMELTAPNRRQAMRLERLYEKKAELIYNMVMSELLDDEDEDD